MIDAFDEIEFVLYFVLSFVAFLLLFSMFMDFPSLLLFSFHFPCASSIFYGFPFIFNVFHVLVRFIFRVYSLSVCFTTVRFFCYIVFLCFMLGGCWGSFWGEGGLVTLSTFPPPFIYSAPTNPAIGPSSSSASGSFSGCSTSINSR